MNSFSLLSSLLFFLLFSSSAVSEEIVTGKIDGGAESYEGVEIEYVGGRDAILTITRTDSETGQVIGDPESIKLHDIKSKDKLHALFVQKGFTKKSDEEIAKITKERKLQQQKEEAEKDKKMLDKYQRTVVDYKERIEKLEETIKTKQLKGEDTEKDQKQLDRFIEQLPRMQEKLDNMLEKKKKIKDEL